MPELPRWLEIVLVVVSVTFFVGTLAAIPVVVRRLPADYFARPRPPHSLAKKIVRNAVGVLLVAAGIAMLILPGQGIITVLLGLSILDLPIKDRALRWLLERPKIQEGVQRIRSKAGKPPLVIPRTA
jgi:hypothetical protein